ERIAQLDLAPAAIERIEREGHRHVVPALGTVEAELFERRLGHGVPYGAPRWARRMILKGFDAEHPAQDRLLDVKAVLGLVEHHRLRAVDHLVGDLVATVRRQAVHEKSV